MSRERSYDLVGLFRMDLNSKCSTRLSRAFFDSAEKF